jgi:hypothetical protein
MRVLGGLRRPEVLVVATVAVLAVGVEAGWRATGHPTADTLAAATPLSTSATGVTAPASPAAPVGPMASATRTVPAAASAGRLTPTPSPTRTAARSGTPPLPADPGPVGPWPGAGNTGWQHTGVQLTPFACTGDVTEITKAGTVIDGKDIGCGLLIRTDAVTISRSRVSTGQDIPIRTEDGRRGLRITDVEIAGQPGCIAAIGYEGWTATRVNIHGCGDGVRIENGSTLQDSWIHDFWDGTKNGQQIDDPHHDGAQSTGGSNLTVRHNRIDNPHDQTSCMLIGGEFGSPSNVLIEDNYLNGGNYSIYLDPKGSNRVIRNNTFTRNYVYGPLRLEGTYTFTGNHYTDGKPVQP